MQLYAALIGVLLIALETERTPTRTTPIDVDGKAT